LGPRQQTFFPPPQQIHQKDIWYDELTSNLRTWFETNKVPMMIPAHQAQPSDYSNHLNKMIDEFVTRNDRSLQAYKQGFQEKEVQIGTILLTGQLHKDYHDLLLKYQELFERFNSTINGELSKSPPLLQVRKQVDITIFPTEVIEEKKEIVQETKEKKKKKVDKEIDNNNYIRRSVRTRAPPTKRYEGDEVSFLPIPRSRKKKTY
jgi:hypothetical protein